MMYLLGSPQRISLLKRIVTVTDQQVHGSLRLRLSTASTKIASCPVDGVDKEYTSAKPFDAIPGPGGIFNLPVVGFLFHLKPFGKYTTGTMHLLFDEMIERYGPTFKIRTNIPTVVITEPKDLTVMIRNEGKYPFRPTIELLEVYYKRTGRRPNIASLQGLDWWKTRAPMQRMLMKPRQLSQYLPQMNRAADDFIQLLKGDYLEKCTPEEAFMAYMAETAGIAFFNKRLGFLDKVQSDETKKLKQATIDAFRLLLKTLVGGSNAFRLYRSKDYQTFESALNYLAIKSMDYVKEVKNDAEERKRNGTFDSDEPNMLLSLLSNASEEDVALTMEGLYFAAIDSSSSGLQVVLHALAKYPEKQEKLRKEIHDVVGGIESNDNVTQGHLDKMPYLKACLKEVYRCYPVIPFGPSRVLPEDVVLGGYQVPAGTQIYNYNARACRDETVFENPYNFEPERWLRENKQKGNDDKIWAVLPFGVGPRSCPGRRLFEQELYLLLVKLIQKIKVELEPESMDIEFEYKLFLKSVKPLRFSFTPLET